MAAAACLGCLYVRSCATRPGRVDHRLSDQLIIGIDECDLVSIRDLRYPDPENRSADERDTEVHGLANLPERAHNKLLNQPRREVERHPRRRLPHKRRPAP